MFNDTVKKRLEETNFSFNLPIVLVCDLEHYSVSQFNPNIVPYIIIMDMLFHNARYDVFFPVTMSRATVCKSTVQLSALCLTSHIV